MKFETIRNKKKTITLTVIGLLLGATIILSVSLAKYMTTKSVPIAEGNINYIIPDMKIVAIQVENDEGEYVSSNTIPMGYALNADSYCEYYDTETKTNVRTGTIKYDSKLTIEGLTNRNSKCYLKFDKLEAKTISEIIASKTIEEGPFDYGGERDNVLYKAFYGYDSYDEAPAYYYVGNPGDNNLKFAGYNWHILSYVDPENDLSDPYYPGYHIRIMLNEELPGNTISVEELLDETGLAVDDYQYITDVLETIWMPKLSNYADYFSGYEEYDNANLNCTNEGLFTKYGWPDADENVIYEHEELKCECSMEGEPGENYGCTQSPEWNWYTGLEVYEAITPYYEADDYSYHPFYCDGDQSPIGLIHAQELVFAGFGFEESSDYEGSYLERNSEYLTSTPAYLKSLYYRTLGENGNIYETKRIPGYDEMEFYTLNGSVLDTASRAHYYPVITLYDYKNNSELLLAGSGTEEDPYTIVTNNN